MSDIERLLKALREAVKGTMAKGEVGILFSGGLDSGILAALAGDHGDPRLYTVGVEGSHDLRTGRETAEELRLPWTQIALTPDEVITATRRTQVGSGRLRVASNRPSAASLACSASKARRSAPSPASSRWSKARPNHARCPVHCQRAG